MSIVAFQGERGAYSEEAIRQQFGPDITTLPCAFEDIFEASRKTKPTTAPCPSKTPRGQHQQMLTCCWKIQGHGETACGHNLLTIPGNAAPSQVRTLPGSASGRLP